MFERRKTKQIHIADVGIGSDYPISVQSMTNTDTRDFKSTVNQIKKLEEAGCELIRLAIVDQQAAHSLKEIKKYVSVPLIADIHFDYRLAIASIESGVDSLRINPGNIGSKENIKKLVDKAKERKIPIRIGVNSGSLEKEFSDLNPVDAMVASAIKHIKLLEHYDYEQIKVSIKSSSVPVTIKAYRSLAKKVDYPLHLGVTESGTYESGAVKSSIGIGALLAEGIGDTIRVSLTDDPVKEVLLAFEILKALEIRKKGINFISCPTCGRTEIDLINLAKRVESATKTIKTSLTIAVMGCVVNGPGEASHADIGIAGGKDICVVFKKGQIVRTIPECQAFDAFMEELQSLL